MRSVSTALALCIVPLLLSGCGGLDFKTNQDVRAYYARFSATNGTGPGFAIRRTLETVSGPVTIIETDISTGYALSRDIASRGFTPESFANSDLALAYGRANIFPVEKLATGQLKTLDGKTHQVECEKGNITCTIDGRISGFGGSINVNVVGGSIYESNGYLDF